MSATVRGGNVAMVIRVGVTDEVDDVAVSGGVDDGNVDTDGGGLDECEPALLIYYLLIP